jgi:hypothetical protein
LFIGALIIRCFCVFYSKAEAGSRILLAPWRCAVMPPAMSEGNTRPRTGTGSPDIAQTTFTGAAATSPATFRRIPPP